MRFKRFGPLLFASLSLCSFNTFQSVEASIKKQFQNQSSCSYETATFKSEYNNVNRYCITPDKRVILYFMGMNDSILSSVQEGFLGKNEVKSYTYPTVYGFGSGLKIWFWDIEGDKLVRYVCVTSDYSNCSDEVERTVMAKKLIVTKRKNLNNSNENRQVKYNKLLEKGIQLYANKKYFEAKKTFSSALYLRTGQSTEYAYLNRGYTNYMLKDYNLAISDFDQVIRINKKNGSAYLYKGISQIAYDEVPVANEVLLEACNNIKKAKKLGDKQAIKILKKKNNICKEVL